VIDPSVPGGGTPRLLWDYNTEDRTAAPGSLLYQYDPASDRTVPITSPDGRYYYLTGTGASKGKEGDRPYLDRMEIATGKTERLWQSTPPSYENVVALLDPAATKAIIQRQSPTDRPDYYVLDVGSKKAARLTNLPDPAPFFSNVKAERITYMRPDGVQLSATMYLPPGYDRARDGKLPFFLWAYPQEFMSADAASQVGCSTTRRCRSWQRMGRSRTTPIFPSSWPARRRPSTSSKNSVSAIANAWRSVAIRTGPS
jgi:dipeptidyl aminopeptidase/acylaminoacyl peptidase